MRCTDYSVCAGCDGQRAAFARRRRRSDGLGSSRWPRRGARAIDEIVSLQKRSVCFAAARRPRVADRGQVVIPGVGVRRGRFGARRTRGVTDRPCRDARRRGSEAAGACLGAAGRRSRLGASRMRAVARARPERRVSRGVGAATAAAGVRCRCTSVPRDRALCGARHGAARSQRAVPGTIALRVRGAAADAAAAPAATVLALAGGPGQAATPLLDAFASVLRPLLRTRELVAFDQRGTGGSGRLSCPRSPQPRLARDRRRPLRGRARARGARPTRRPRRWRTSRRCARRSASRSWSSTGLVRDEGRARLRGRVPAARRAARARLGRPARGDRPLPAQHARVDPARAARGVRRRLPLHARPRRGAGGARSPAGARRAARHGARRTRARRTACACPRRTLLGLLLDGDFDRFLRAALPGGRPRRADRRPGAAAAPAVRGGGAGSRSAGTDSDAVYVATTCEDGGCRGRRARRWPSAARPSTPRPERSPRAHSAVRPPRRARSARPTCAAAGRSRRSPSRSRRCRRRRR